MGQNSMFSFLDSLYHQDAGSRSMMSEDEKSAYLEHYGRKGMKWGQHIFGEDDPSGGGSKKQPVKVDSYKRKQLTDMSKKERTQTIGETVGKANILIAEVEKNKKPSDEESAEALKKGKAAADSYFKSVHDAIVANTTVTIGSWTFTYTFIRGSDKPYKSSYKRVGS